MGALHIEVSAPFDDSAGRGDPGSAAALAQLDVSDLPLVIEAARLAQDADDQSRFLFGLDALVYGFARWLEPGQQTAYRE